MTPRFFRFLPWDYRPYGVPQQMSHDVMKVIFDKNDSSWMDIISSRSNGFFLSNCAVAGLCGESILNVRDATQCRSEKPIYNSAGRFPGYWLVSLESIWEVSTVDYQWPDTHGKSERIVVESPYGAHMGRLRRVRSGERLGLYCDAKLVLAARRRGLTNFWFRPVDLPDKDNPDAFEPPFRIDYLGEQWPPQWYPKGFEPHPNNLVDDIPSDPLRAG